MDRCSTAARSTAIRGPTWWSTRAAIATWPSRSAAAPTCGRGSVRVTASPYQLDGQPVHPQGPAPYRVGENTRDVLSNLLGYDEARIASLLKDGVVEAP